MSEAIANSPGQREMEKILCMLSQPFGKPNILNDGSSSSLALEAPAGSLGPSAIARSPYSVATVSISKHEI